MWKGLCLGAAGRVTPPPTGFMIPGLTTHCSAVSIGCYPICLRVNRSYISA